MVTVIVAMKQKSMCCTPMELEQSHNASTGVRTVKWGAKRHLLQQTSDGAPGIRTQQTQGQQGTLGPDMRGCGNAGPGEKRGSEDAANTPPTTPQLQGAAHTLWSALPHAWRAARRQPLAHGVKHATMHNNNSNTPCTPRPTSPQRRDQSPQRHNQLPASALPPKRPAAQVTANGHLDSRACMIHKMRHE